MATNAGGLCYIFDANTVGLLRAEREVNSSTRKV